MRSILTALALTLMLAACATPATTSSTPSSSADAGTEATKAEKDRAACEKMCEVAGNAEDNADAVAACQAKCDTGP